MLKELAAIDELNKKIEEIEQTKKKYSERGIKKILLKDSLYVNADFRACLLTLGKPEISDPEYDQTLDITLDETKALYLYLHSYFKEEG